LAEAFEHWPNLQYLNIGDCLLGGTGGIHVVKSLTKCCPDIKRIALFFNEINENGAKLIPAMIQHKKHLESLELNGNNFEGDGPVAQAIRDMLRSMGKDDVLDELDEMEIDSDAEEEEDEEETIEKPESSPELSDITELMTKVSVQ
jgi:Ran GTPase-activating protein 1